MATLTERIEIHLISGMDGFAHVAIHPSDILLSLHPLESSARNCFPAKVARVTADDRGVRLDADAGVLFHAQITRASCEEMGIRPGSQVFLTFKASSVHVL